MIDYNHTQVMTWSIHNCSKLLGSEKKNFYSARMHLIDQGKLILI